MTTDEKIIKAFECCEDDDGTNPKCSECPFNGLEEGKCFTFVRKGILEIVNRQKAENEALQTENKQLQSDVLIANQNYEHIKEIWEADKTRLSEKIKEYIDKHNELIGREAAIKAEAVKEVATRLKERAVLRCFDPILGTKIAFSEDDLNNLVKEMAGADND